MNDNMFLQFTAKTERLTSSLKKINGGLVDINTKTGKIGTGFGSWFTKIKKTNMAFTNLNKDVNRGVGIMNKYSASLGNLFSVAKIYMLSRYISNTIRSAMDMVEVANLFKVAMGGAVEEAQDFAIAVSSISGLDITNIQSAMGTYSLLARSMGMVSEQSNTLSTYTTQLAYDLSSLTNVPINQVLGDLRSGLVGQSETVYKYGLDVTEAGIKTEAMIQGIEKSVRNMSQGEKMALRYSAMIRQSALAHGDFAKTIETPANQLRILQDRFVTLSRAVGTIFIPVLTEVLPYLNAMVALLTEAIQNLAILFGYQSLGEDYFKPIETGLDNISDTSEEVADEISTNLKNALSGFDELNILNPLGAGGQGVTTDPIMFNLPTYESNVLKIKQRSEEIKEDLRKIFQDLADMSKPIRDAFGDLQTIVLDNLDYVYKEILIPMGEWSKTTVLPIVIESIAKAIGNLSKIADDSSPIIKRLNDSAIKPFMQYVTDNKESVTDGLSDVLTILLGFIALKNIITTINVLTRVFRCFGLLFNPNSLIIVGLGVLAGLFIDAYNESEDFRKGIDDLHDKVLKPFGNFLSTIFTDAVEGVNEVLKFLNEYVVKPLGEEFKKTIPVLNNFFQALIKNTEELWEVLKLTFGSDKKDGKGGFFNYLGETIKNQLNIAGDSLRGFVTFLTGAFTNDWDLAWRGLSNIFIGFVNGFIRGYNSLLDVMKLPESLVKRVAELPLHDLGVNGEPPKIGTIEGNNLYKGFYSLMMDTPSNFSPLNNTPTPTNKNPNVIDLSRVPMLSPTGNSSYLGNPLVPLPALETLMPNYGYARGGMTSAGEIFRAGEQGKAELLGSFNNKTTVMPLEDSGFIEAMYGAVKSAMSESDSSFSINNVIQLDSEVVYRNQEKVKRNRGRDFGMGVFST